MSHSASNSSDSQETQKARRLQHLTLGQLGEDLTVEWLKSQGGRILERRWRCRRGELDLIALMPAQASSRFLMAFVEVKTRSRGSWDEGGLLSITPAKQRKIWQGAQNYLAQHPRYAPLPCRLDVALIHSQKLHRHSRHSHSHSSHHSSTEVLKIGQPVQRGEYQLTLQHYLKDAFRLD